MKQMILFLLRWFAAGVLVYLCVHALDAVVAAAGHLW